MKKWHLPYIIGMVAVMVAVFFFISYPLAKDAGVNYQGKEVFRTESEYTQFKEAIGGKGIGISDINILASEPPIIVQFEVNVPYDKQFAYGNPVVSYRFNIVAAGLFTFVIIGMVGIWLPVELTWRENKSKAG